MATDLKSKMASLGTSGVLDLEELVMEWAERWYNKHERQNLQQFSKPKWEDLRVDIDKSNFIMDPEEPDFFEGSKTQSRSPKKPKGHVLFKSTFVNSTQLPQEYTFNMNRRTTSTCHVNITDGHKWGKNMGVTLKVPEDLIQVSAGCTKEFEIVKENGQTFEEELVWTIDTPVKVPKRTKTTASVLIRESEFNGGWSQTTQFSGRFIINLWKDNKKISKLKANNLAEIFPESLGFVHDQNKRVSLTTRGVCNFRFCVEQNVELSEEPLPEPLANGV